VIKKEGNFTLQEGGRSAYESKAFGRKNFLKEKEAILKRLVRHQNHRARRHRREGCVLPYRQYKTQKEIELRLQTQIKRKAENTSGRKFGRSAQMIREGTDGKRKERFRGLKEKTRSLEISSEASRGGKIKNSKGRAVSLWLQPFHWEGGDKVGTQKIGLSGKKKDPT